MRTKPRAFIQIKECQDMHGRPIDPLTLKDDDIEGETYNDVITSSEVEVMFWGNKIVYERDMYGKIINTFSETVAFCREHKTGIVWAMSPEDVRYEKEFKEER